MAALPSPGVTWRLRRDPSSPSSGYTGDFVHGEQEGDGSFENAEEGTDGHGPSWAIT